MTEFRKLPFVVALGLLLVLVPVEAASCYGIGLGALAVFDLLLLMTATLIGLPFVISHAAVGRLQGAITLLASAGILILAFAVLGMALVLLFKILGALYFPPAYFALYARFPVTQATLTLSLIMLLKVAFTVCLVLAHEKLLTNTGLVILVATSLLLTIMLGFLHGMPRVFVSITDCIGAIVIGIFTIIRAIGFMLASLPAMKKALGL